MAGIDGRMRQAGRAAGELSNMHRRTLGKQGLEVSAIGLGCLSSPTSAAGQKEALTIPIIHRALDRGVTFFDTAEAYGPWENERQVGKALKRVRDSVQIATKFGYNIVPGGPRPYPSDSRPEQIRRVCDASLQRLGVDVIDLFYQHRTDPQVPIEEVAGTVGELVQAGKVRYFGLCEASANTIRRAHAVHPLSAVESEYSLWTRDIEDGVLPACRELGIGIVPFSPLGRGFLAGSATDPDALPPTDFRRDMPRWQGDALKTNRRLAATFRQIAEAKGRTPGQLALAWLLHQGDQIVPIPATTKLHRVDENMAAAEIALSREELAEIDAVLPRSAWAGARYDARGMATLDRS